MKRLQYLPEIADELLGGLHADDALRQRVLAAQRTARWTPRKAVLRLAPVCAAALIITFGGWSLLRNQNNPAVVNRIDTTSAGAVIMPTQEARGLLDVTGSNPTIGANNAAAPLESLFAKGNGGNFPLIGYNGNAYRMLNIPVDAAMLSSPAGTVAVKTDEPSLADADTWSGLLSNVVAEGADVYAVSGLSTDTALAASVEGATYLFQRVSYAGYGAGGGSLESVLDIRGKVSWLAFSGVGTVSDSNTANELINLLLDNASFQNDDGLRGDQTLQIHLNNGLVLQLVSSKGNFAACGTWSCKDFRDAYEGAMDQ